MGSSPPGGCARVAVAKAMKSLAQIQKDGFNVYLERELAESARVAASAVMHRRRARSGTSTSREPGCVLTSLGDHAQNAAGAPSPAHAAAQGIVWLLRHPKGVSAWSSDLSPMD